MIEERYYDEWNEVKKELQTNGKIFQFREREIWWYAAGENIGSEISGKSLRFSRPILIFRKYGKTTFFGVPLSTRQGGDVLWYSDITVDKKKRCALLSQAGSFSAKRLYSKIGVISKGEFEELASKLNTLLFKK